MLGKSPLAFFQDLRIERAVHLLKTSHSSVDQIAANGYADGVTLRVLLRRPDSAAACVKSAAACNAGCARLSPRPVPAHRWC